MTSSVCICTYNGASYIIEQLNSIIKQRRLPDEIILSDDNSFDDTVKLAKAILDDSGLSYKIIRNRENLGYSKNFEQCMKNSSGDIIFLCDQDDIWHSDKIFLTMKAFENDEDCVMVYHDARLIDKEGKILSESAWGELDLKADGFKGANTPVEIFRKILMYRWIVYGNSLAIKRKMLDVLPVPDANSELGGKSWTHDSWLAINSWSLGKIVFLNERLIDYRQHDNNLTGISNKTLTDREKAVARVQRVLFYLKAHRLRLQIFLDKTHVDIDDKDANDVRSYIELFQKNEKYEDATAVEKFILLLKFFVFNTFKQCGIKRGEILTYILYQLGKS